MRGHYEQAGAAKRGRGGAFTAALVVLLCELKRVGGDEGESYCRQRMKPPWFHAAEHHRQHQLAGERANRLPVEHGGQKRRLSSLTCFLYPNTCTIDRLCLGTDTVESPRRQKQNSSSRRRSERFACLGRKRRRISQRDSVASFTSSSRTRLSCSGWQQSPRASCTWLRHKKASKWAKLSSPTVIGSSHIQHQPTRRLAASSVEGARAANGGSESNGGESSDNRTSDASDGLKGRAGATGYVRPEVPGWRHKAVIIPGFATDGRAFEELCHSLDRRGIASVVVPIRWYHWLPTLGGRSVRPILDRIHETVIRCVAARAHADLPYAFNEPGLQNEVAPYTIPDFLAEMGDPKRGAHHMGPLDLPLVPDMPAKDDRVVLIAHSAGGWMSRIYLSKACYDGRMYNASSLVNGLVTLGTPHVQLQDKNGRDRDLPFSRNFRFVEKFCTGEKGGRWEDRVPTACVGGAVQRGRSMWGGLLKDLVYLSYELCCGTGTGIGDGITPLQSSFDMAGAKLFLELEGVYHTAGFGGPWYGSENVIDSWLEPSLDTIFGPSSSCAASADAADAADYKGGEVRMVDS